MTLRIRHKLFIAILFANMILATGIYYASNWSLSSSFKEYLDSLQADKLAPLVNAVADIYKQEGSWDWVKAQHHRRWRQLMHRYVIKRPPPPFGPPGGLHRPPPPHLYPPPPPPPGAPMAINAVIFLADSHYNLILGPPDKKQAVYWLPIIVDKATVGYIGFFRNVRITNRLDKFFLYKFQSNFGWVILGMILLSAVIALVLARQLVKPVERLRVAAQKITSGQYKTRIDKLSQDELGELSRDFNRLAETLSKNLDARQQWVADISHELRTPVSVLQGELEALQDGVRSLTGEAIDSLHQEIVRLSHLVNDLHQLSLSDMGALSYKHEIINVTDILSEVITSRVTLLEDKKIEIVFDDKQDIILFGDYHRLTQLFYNLINNSIAYTRHGGCIHIESRIQDGEVELVWEDSSPGVDDDDLTKLFDRLYRADKSRNRNKGGSGLGLAICENIVKAHGGTIVASHSRLGGVKFTMLFPKHKRHEG